MQESSFSSDRFWFGDCTPSSSSIFSLSFLLCATDGLPLLAMAVSPNSLVGLLFQLVICRELDDELQNSLYDFLETRGINDELCVFLHQYMKNKDKLEFIRWMEKAKAFIERK